MVIVGAMFKILHLPGASEMLGIGLTTEAIIFFLSAFEPKHKEVDWSKVYPELADDFDGPTVAPRRSTPVAVGDGTSQQMDKLLADAKIGPELLDSLGKGMKSLAETTNKLSTLGDAAVATNEYATNVKQATKSMVDMNKAYVATATAVTEMANATRDAKEYHSQVQSVTKNLSALNAVYEMELQDANTHLKAMQKFYSNVGAAMESIAQAGKDTEQFKGELSKLTSNITQLNKVYGNMLTAMKG